MTAAAFANNVDATYTLLQVKLDTAEEMASLLRMNRNDAVDRPVVLTNPEIGFFAVLVDVDEYNLLRATRDFFQSDSVETEIHGNDEYDPRNLMTFEQSLVGR